jgi:hypothetical protein
LVKIADDMPESILPMSHLLGATVYQVRELVWARSSTTRVRKSTAWRETGAALTVDRSKMDETELVSLWISHHTPAISVLVEVLDS